MVAAIILHCSHHQLHLQHTNISAHIISSGMERLTYLSASTFHLTLSTDDAFSELDFSSADRIYAPHVICWSHG